MFYFLLENATQGVPISFLLPGTSKIEHELQIEIELSNPRLKNGPLNKISHFSVYAYKIRNFVPLESCFYNVYELCGLLLIHLARGRRPVRLKQVCKCKQNQQNIEIEL